MRGAVFFDRDGVLNEDVGYLHRAADFRWVDGARDALRIVADLGLAAIVVTNQSGVARGYYTMDDVETLHDWMRRDLARDGLGVTAFYACPFHEDADVPQYRVPDHPDRKPNPGMINRAVDEWQLDRERCLLIGDKDSDMEAAKAAGIRGALFRGGNLADFVSLLSSTLCPD